MTLERISAFITYCVALLLAWLGDLSLKDVSTITGLALGIITAAVTCYLRWKAYQLLRDGKISRGEYESFNR
ncbi:TPA: hypothetical protein N5N97_001547 [Enterobacter bugandensis]|nr:hypothetical protein [Enterobacter bugandensis]HCM9511342.1 hypothetical protein [Enterobacter bugandensis]